MEWNRKENYTVEDLREIMRILRGKEGCPWDREQTHASIRKNFLEETYEVLEAIDENDTALLREELGDVLLQVIFHTQMEEETGSFRFEDVVTGICNKLIIRHPHIFSDTKADTADKVLKNWDAIKRKEKRQETFTETLEQVPKVLPALMRSEKVQQRASRAGFDYPDKTMAFEDLISEVNELQNAVTAEDYVNIAEELGDILFSCVNISRFYQLDSEKSLTNATEKFINRFREVERLAIQRGLDMQTAGFEALDALWKCAKQGTKEVTG